MKMKMARIKTFTVKVKESFRKGLIVSAIVVIVAFLLIIFDGLSEIFAKWFDTTTEKVQEVAATIVWFGVGLILLQVAALTAAVPLLAITLALVGVIIIGYEAFRLFGNPFKLKE